MIDDDLGPPRRTAGKNKREEVDEGRLKELKAYQ